MTIQWVDMISERNACLSLRITANQVTCSGTTDFFRGIRPDVCTRPDVPFVKWSWKDGSLHLSNDRYGFFPVFYTTLEHGPDQELLISPSLQELLQKGARRDLDWRAIAVLMRLDSFVGDDTPFRHIRVLPPSARITILDGRFHIEGTLPIYREDSGLSREAALNGYVDLFRQAVGSMPADQALVPLSGGRDSRHILLELARQRAPGLRTLSIQLEPFLSSDDPQVAAVLAEFLGVPHEIMSARDNPVRMEREKNRLTHWMTLEHRWLVAASIQPRSAGISVYEGVAGDKLSTSRITPEMLKLLEAGKLREIAASYMSSEHYLRKALPPDFYRQASIEVAVDRVTEELNRHTGTCNPLGSFQVFNRTRRVTGLAPCSLWRAGGAVWCPYLHGPLFDFLRSIPVAHLLGGPYHQFHTDAIALGYPEAAGIPYSVNNARPAVARLFNWVAALEMGCYGVRQPQRLLTRNFLMPRIARALLDPRDAKSVRPLLTDMVYLMQLEALADGRWDDV